MSRIVTGHHGTRYRLVIPSNPLSRPGSRAYKHNTRSMVLPRIPDWPLPGPAPQYLSSNFDTPMKKGDTVLWLDRNGVHTRIDQRGGGTLFEWCDVDAAPCRPGHPDYDPMYRGPYLITRADPEEDV